MNPETNTNSQEVNNNKMKLCKHCGAQIAKSAKVCPRCGGKNKKPFYLRWWFITLAILIVLGAVGGNTATKSGSTPSGGVSEQRAESTPKPTPTPVEYTTYNVSEMMDDLKANALKAADKYEKQYVRITGKLSVIDSSGKYISLLSSDDPYAFIGVTCNIKNNDQKDRIREMSIGEQVTLCGKITKVGEALGYWLDIDSIE